MKNVASSFVAVVLLLLACQSVKAQSDVPKVEVGGHYTFISFNSADCTNCMREGFGGRLTYNITRNMIWCYKDS
jgi:hypothetical protein